MTITVGRTSITFNDGTTQTTAAAAVTTATVLAATAGASVGAVGTYAFLVGIGYNTAILTEGSNYAGSSLRYCGNEYSGAGSTVFGASSGAAPAGTWKCMGRGGSGFAYPMTLFLRIS